MVFLIVSGIFYIVYGFFANISDIILDSTGKYFYPLAHLLCPKSEGAKLFYHAGFMQLFLVIPSYGLYFIADMIESVLYKNYTKEIMRAERLKKARNAGKMVKNAQTSPIEQSCYKKDMVLGYSICLSIDYASKNNLDEEKKGVFNNFVYAKLKTELLKRMPYLEIMVHSCVFIVKSQDYTMYDYVYETILEVLAKAKQNSNPIPRPKPKPAPKPFWHEYYNKS